MRLSPCPECARHVRVDAGVCPFCDHPLPVPTARARVGALLIGAAAISTLTACPRAATKYGGPPPPEPQPTEVETTLEAPEEPLEPVEDTAAPEEADDVAEPDAS
ncbi:hypothetical protein [Paraliomyxa miuraensis]|uniref:hypothetical protein n=1 Tax=Paraliomyxa miuraensis TaxID=376150 RepID=UPI002255B997|nr:hypothetical protein [Paraliomyxa miuraensis]MCX4245344.1 hypothetical protein [Paraliomyxa miuraensis]